MTAGPSPMLKTTRWGTARAVADQVQLITAGQLLRHYRRALFDHGQAARTAIEHHLGPTRCSSGCAYCCYSKVIVDLAEGVMMYLFLKASDQWTAALEQRLLEADRAMTAVPHRDWLLQRRPCVFLKEVAFGEGTCRVYPLRPIACASTHSVREPDQCAVPEGQHVAWVSPAAGRFWGQLHVSIMRGFSVDEPLALTLPGSVLYAHALVEGLPLPDVHRIPIADMQEGSVPREHVFDETGAARGGGHG
jgi:Fe-S-cluster containining protein